MNRPVLGLLCLSFAIITAAAADKPNIIFILCDDLGSGDVKCLNPEGKIATPHMDRLAKEGVKFTDAHSGSSVCTPTRYGIMTGRYAWRSKLQSGVLGGLSPRLIEQGRTTVASLLKEQGYSTHCVGKWHLGMDWVRKGEVAELNIESAEQVNNVDYTKPIANGPTSVGFDTYFGISASLDMVPYCFIENDHVTANPTETMKLEMNAAGGKKSFTREGPGAPGFRGEDVLPALTGRAKKIIAEKAAAKGSPFFIYLPLNSPHTPILPSEKWVGKSGISLYADFVMETDDAIGQIMRATEDAGIGQDTLIIVTSDNGCSPSADYPKLATFGHNPSAIYRGHKADIFDGGHRVPFIVRWPAKVKGGQTSTQLVCLTDFMATAADIVGAKLPDNAAEDSFSFLPALLGESSTAMRKSVIHHSINGSFALRDGDWKLEICAGSGGWSDPRPGSPGEKGLPDTQLYNLKDDIAEKTNLQGEKPDIVAQMTKQLEKIVADGRSTPGNAQKNAVEVKIRKPIPAAKAKKKSK
ncbi:arylsulfatase [Prosthecobacter sp.]|jgi:arylsulfatase A|uniref:arylsulfatase n=1 Tax=Prosthecobacter sp. TaxID=1965333 RepID=UPI00378423A1